MGLSPTLGCFSLCASHKKGKVMTDIPMEKSDDKGEMWDA